MKTPKENKKDKPRGWHSRGYLPHFDGGNICQFITIHLADALPKKVINKWKWQLANEDEETAKLILQRRIEKYIDLGYGECYLKNDVVAQQVQNSLIYFHEKRYKLIS